MTGPIRLAIVGLGRWGTHLVRNFLALPQARLVALVDPSHDQMGQLRQQLGISAEVPSFTQWQAALALPNLDAVVVATPAASHYGIIRAALERQLHVLAEKPLALDPVACRDLWTLARQQERQLVVDHTYLFHPAVRQGQVILQSGRLGAYRYGYATRTNLGPVRQDVNALWDLAIHDIAIFNYWLNHKPHTVAASGQVWLQPDGVPHFPQGLVDGGWLTLTYPNQLVSTIHVSWLNPDKQRRLAVVGERGTLVLDELADPSPLTLYAGQLSATADGWRSSPIQPLAIPVEPIEPLRQVCRHFLDCVRDNQPSAISSAQTAMDLITVLQAASQSVQQGGKAVPIVYG